MKVLAENVSFSNEKSLQNDKSKTISLQHEIKNIMLPPCSMKICKLDVVNEMFTLAEV